MKPSDVFGLIVRLLGLPLLMYALWLLIYGVLAGAGLAKQSIEHTYSYFIWGGSVLPVSLYLLRGAPVLMRFSYPQEDQAPPSVKV